MDWKRIVSAKKKGSLREQMIRYYWPFWLFKDASQGTRYARESAYRHNCEMSVCLPTYVGRWSLLCAIALATIVACDRLPEHFEIHKSVYLALTTGAGLMFTCCFAIVCIILSIYARLRFG